MVHVRNEARYRSEMTDIIHEKDFCTKGRILQKIERSIILFYMPEGADWRAKERAQKNFVHYPM